MDSKASSSLLSFTIFLFFFFSTASAFNITRLLDQFPDFGSFNQLLTKTELYKQINARRTITVLALNDAAVSAITANTEDVVKEILSVHVILDYYDITKLRKLSTDKTTVLTTMYQSSGIAMNEQGFLKLVLNKEGVVEFGSASKGGSFNAKLVKAVAAQPYNISVLQISAPIFVPGIGINPSPPPPSAQVPAPAPKKSPAPAPSADAPAPAEDDADAPTADSPEADAPAESPEDAPTSSPPKPADKADDEADAPSPEADDSGASRIHVIGALMVLLGISMAV